MKAAAGGSHSIGQPVRRKEDFRLLTGGGSFVDDLALAGLAHAMIARSPHAHAEIVSIDKTAALSVPGIHAALTFEDAPDRLFSTARHEKNWMDPDDTRVLDNVVRFIGQKEMTLIL